MQKILPKKDLKNFIESLMKKYEIIAPVKDGITKFKIIKTKSDLNNLYLKEITLAPFKEFLIPEKEELLNFKDGKAREVVKKPKKKTIVFGLRKCDLNAILILDKVMYDNNYKIKRKNMVLVGLHCEHPDKYCFCNSMELEDFHDLFFYEENDNYYISIGSDKGKNVVKSLKKSNKEVIKKIQNFKALSTKDIQEHYNNKIWKTDADKCLSCGACTAYCPTCNCFNLKDELDINLKDGKRFRETASCQLHSFSRVAGGKKFRASVLARFKHFVYHKIVYFKKQKGKYMCVGCGRCLRVCPPRIDWVNTINLMNDLGKMKEEHKGGKK
jgi:sulfhydrogenase subunit beta (sulfur reductase)